LLFKHYYGHLFKYNDWATKATIQSINEISSPTERIISLISHILAAQQIWFSRIIGEKSTLSPWEVYTIDECFKISEIVNERYTNFLEHTSDAGLEKIIHYSNTRGERFENSIKDILTHVINHSTYHRAQIALLVKEAGSSPAVTDYIVYQRSAHS
jgi:uncharacterized damage-inducible protein DinB